MKNIYFRENGYLVIVRWGGECRTRRFGLRRHGSKRAALKAAVAWRDLVEREIGKPRTDHKVGKRPLPASGIAGIVRYKPSAGAPVWEAQINVDGSRLRKRFSVRRWGEEGARLKAVSQRIAWEVRFFGAQVIR